MLKKKVNSSTTLENIFENLIDAVGEDRSREGLQKTALRAAQAYADLTKGYHEDPVAILTKAIFKSNAKDLVLVKNIEFYSLCEHHLLPFYGSCCIAYLPKGKIIGLSKFARLTDVFARRFQVQENLTAQIAHGIQSVIKPYGVMVMMEAEHMCMRMRGVEKKNSSMVTVCALGEFSQDLELQANFFKLVKQ